MTELPVVKSPSGCALGRDEVLSILRTHKPELARQFGVTSLALFGSTSRNSARPDSDVDILVNFGKLPSLFRQLFPIEHYLEDVLGRKVDLIYEPGLDPRIRSDVAEDLIYA